MNNIQNIYISIIVPCYNEENAIELTHAEIIKVIKNNQYNYELIYVDDGSIDETFDKIIQFAKVDKNVRILKLSRNFGEQAAISAGINNCKGDIAIIIEADLQDPPEVISQMINKYQEGNANVIYGVRKSNRSDKIFKKISANLYYRLINKMSETNLPLHSADFRLIDRKVINTFNSFRERKKYIRGIISWIGFKQLPIYYSRKKRIAGSTKYTLSKMFDFAATGLLYFTKKPLKFVKHIGLILFIAGVVLLVALIFLFFSSHSQNLSSWHILGLLIILLSGIQLISIGIIGEYISGIFDEAKNRPEYIIDKDINFE